MARPTLPSPLAILRGLACAAAAAIAAVVLMGWALDLPILKSALPGKTTMKANAAIGLLLAAASVAAVSRSAGGSPPRRKLAAVLATLVVLLGGATLAQYLLHVRLGIDELLFADPLTTSRPYNGRMAPATAAALCALGAGVFGLAVGRTRAAIRTAHALALVPAAIGYLSLAGYAYGVAQLLYFGPFVAVAAPTALALALLATAVLLTRAEAGFFVVAGERPIARGVLLRLLALSVLSPFLTGLLVAWGAKAGFYAPVFGAALFAVAAAGTLALLALMATATVARAEDAMRAARRQSDLRADALQVSEDNYRHAIELSPQTIWTARADGRIDHVGRRWLETTGVAVDRDWWRSVHDEDRAVVFACWTRSLETGAAYDAEFRILRDDGVYVWVHSRANARCDADGRPVRWYGVIEDVTRRKDAEERLRAAEALAHVRARAEAAATARSDFLANMSHELRTPLNAILGFAGLVAAAPELLPETRRRLELVVDAGGSLTAIVDDILDFSKFEAQGVTLSPVAVDLAALLASAAELVRPQVEAKGLALRLRLDPPSTAVLIDPMRLRQVVLNLLGNALKFTRTGEIELSLAAGPAGRLRIAVRDTGVGIPPDRATRIFDRFVQADDTTAREFGGTGLGLTICRMIVEAMDGRIGVESLQGDGSTFWLELAPPCAEEVVPSLAPASRAEVAPGVRLLLVDDNDVNRDLFVALLGDADVTCAENGAEAVEAVRAHAFDLVFMDVQMPVMDGLAATRAIRAAGRTVPIVGLTANVLESQVALCRDAGMNDHIGKPFTRAAITNAVARWTDPSATKSTAAATAVREPAPRAALGAPSFARLCGLLAGQLREAHAALVAARLDPRALGALAHRVRGPAGTLGFTEVAASYLALEEACHREGGPPALDAARLATERALAEIDGLALREAS